MTKERLIEMIRRVLGTNNDLGFSLRNKKTRRGRNPATGKDLTLEPRRVLTFHISPVFKEKLNGNG